MIDSILKNKIVRRIIFSLKLLLNKIPFIWNNCKREEMFKQLSNTPIENIPIFIISFNRLSYLREQINNFEKHGLFNLIIIDNGSTYPPLLDYYKSIPYKVIYNNANDGHLVFWKNSSYSMYRQNFYIVTDPDILLIPECPNDFINELITTLRKYRFANKVGLSLKIDDIPNDTVFGNDVIKWESDYYKVKLKEKPIYYAPIDTTFALYLPDSISRKNFYCALRLGFPYQAQHLPWYKKKDDITDEDIFYSQQKTNGWWNPTANKMTPDKK